MRARLITSGPDGLPVVYDLQPGEPITIGRNQNNTIVLRDDLVSRHHAVVFEESGHWVIRDLEARNGTYVDGRRVLDKAILHDGQEIGIGAAPLRFCHEGDTLERPVLDETPPEAPEGTTSSSYPATALRPDELTVLYGFMVSCMKETDARALVLRALQAVQAQTLATVTAFLSLDQEDPLPKMVLPESTQFDAHISRYLTQRVQRESRAVWLDPKPGEELGESDSLLIYTDAMCIPLRGDIAPLGALHVYRTNQPFTKRDFRFCEILGENLATSLRLLRARRTLEAENLRLRRHAPTPEIIRGTSSAIQELKHRITRAAGPRASTVLITGESGVGKELVALELHRQSPRGDAPMVPFNCAATTSTLVLSQLFGHVKGSFTGADRDHPGLFKQADEGTLFLDEVAELDKECQAKLLRVLETGVFRPVGAERDQKVDTRIIAATNRNLAKEVKAQRFREDLYWRLCVVEIKVPPLRERLEDIPELVNYFLDTLSADCHRRFSVTPEGLEKLKSYDWPGNVRQLRTVLESAVIMNESGVLDVDDLRLGSEVPAQGLPSLDLAELEKWAVQESLRRTKGNRTRAAKMLGVVRDTLANMMKRHKLSVAEAEGEEE
jgi:DNA-binding NtrC family response regulator